MTDKTTTGSDAAPCKYEVYPVGTSPRTCAQCGKGPCRKAPSAVPISATGSDALDLDKLEALAKAAKLSALRPGIQAQAKDYFALVHAMTPDTVLALIAQARAAAPTSQTDLAKRLLDHANNTDGRFGAVSVLKADLIAICCEANRYYSGMMAWKRTAEAKDREFAEARAAAPAATAQSVKSDFERIRDEVDWSNGLTQLLEDYKHATDHGVMSRESVQERIIAYVRERTEPAALSQQPVQAAGEPLRGAFLDNEGYVRLCTAGKEHEYSNFASYIYAAPVIAAPTAPSDWLTLIKRAHRVISCAAIAQIGDGVATWRALGNAIAAADSGAPTATAEPVATIDTPEFRALVYKVWNGGHPDHYRKHIGNLIAHIDGVKLAAPVPQQAPLTDVWIEQIWDELPLTGAYTMAEARIKFARAIERELSAGSAASAVTATTEQLVPLMTEALKDAKKLLELNGVDATDMCDYGNGRADDIINRISSAIDRAAMAATKEKKQ